MPLYNFGVSQHFKAWVDLVVTDPRRILQDAWQFDLRVVESEFTLVGVNPALDQFKDIAAQIRTQAEHTAQAHGRALAGLRAA